VQRLQQGSQLRTIASAYFVGTRKGVLQCQQALLPIIWGASIGLLDRLALALRGALRRTDAVLEIARSLTPPGFELLIAELGTPGEEASLELRLKLLADAALLGFPNAGKSSLLRRISNAKPKVADYPFTTVAPVLGTVEAPDGRQLTVADVPGLLEGASEGVGLGDEFLAHLERARLFLHVVDAQEDVAARFRVIDEELAAYGAGLAERPQIVVLNKLDLVDEAPSFEVDDPRVLAVVATSAVTGEGIEELERALFVLVPERAPARSGSATGSA